MTLRNKQKTIITHNEAETMSLAENIGQGLCGGEIIALNGELGSGKTTFIKGLAKALRVKHPVNSPTFVVLKAYLAKIKKKAVTLVHIDAYRVNSLGDIKSTGIEDYLGRDDVIMVIEWAEKIQSILPPKIRQINFRFVNPEEREISYDFSN